MRFLTIILFVISLQGIAQAQSWQSLLVNVQNNGTIIYNSDDDGFKIPDYSCAGYKGGGIELPNVPTVLTISSIEGDNTAHIQTAIDEVGKLAKNTDGIRGAILLKAGKYDIYGTLYVNYDGVVLRGEGDGDDSSNSTILYAIGNTPTQRDVVRLGNQSTQVNGKTQISNTKSNITTEIVEVGSFSFQVENSALYNIGDRIMIYHPCTQAWVDAVNLGGVPYPDPSAPTDPDERWKVNQFPIVYNRIITNITANEITIDAPVFYTLDKSISQSYIYKPNMNGHIQQVGLENLRIDIETLGGEDENHAWEAARFKSCENSWAKNCTFVHFGHSGIITEACSKSTFVNCSAIDPVAIITGERMYNFNTYVYSQLNLFSNCYARGGRHHYVSNGTSSTSGNVFLRCTSDVTNSVAEGHRQWTQGMLYDNYKEINLKRDFVLGLYNRVAMGTGHGWAAVHSVLWNCDVNSAKGVIGLQQPPTAQNYAIGCKAKTITGVPISNSNFTKGFVEGQNKEGLFPESLYEAQLAARLKLTDAKTLKEKISFNVSPTIANNELKINITDNLLNSSFRIRNINGQIMKEFILNDHYSIFNIGYLPAGVFFVESATAYNLESVKFIKL